MKAKVLSLILVLIFLVLFFVGCTNKETESNKFRGTWEYEAMEWEYTFRYDYVLIFIIFFNFAYMF